MEYLTAADRAKYVRAELKAMYPTIKFSVRSSSYSMGSEVYVHWVDGETEEKVRNTINCLTTDMRELHDIELDTEYNSIMFTRVISPEIWEKVKQEIIKEMIESKNPYVSCPVTIDKRTSYEIEDRSFP